MKTRFYAIALAFLALAGCKPVYDTDKLPIIPEPEPEITYNGSGKLVFGEEAVPMASSYSWSAEGDVIKFSFEVDLEEYAENGDWEIGHLYTDLPSLADFLGIDQVIGAITDDNFQAYEPDGTAASWTSYAPGMWLDTESKSCGWSSGALYWQWYIYDNPEYDYEYASNKGMLIIGGNPGNTVKCGGTTITSKSVITLGERKVDFIVTVKFTGEAPPEPEEPEAPMDYMTCGHNYPYQAASQGDHQYSWIMDEDGITVNVDAYVPAIEGWGYLFIGIDPDAMTDYLDIDDINKLADFEYFYPTDAEGNPDGDKWTSYAPGQWVAADGSASNWADGAMYWQYQFGDNKYEGHYTDGLLVIGTNPENAAKLGGQTVSSHAKLGDKTFTVNVTYHESYPTAMSGTIGANSYSWELTDEAMNIDATLSLATMDDSWHSLGFAINEVYVNDFYDIDIDGLEFEDFYPVDAEGAPYEKWTSFVPGMWMDKNDNPGNSGNLWFWQYYTSEEYDYELPNLVLLGKNPGNAAADFAVGNSYVSKAKLAGHDFIVKVNVVE